MKKSPNSPASKPKTTHSKKSHPLSFLIPTRMKKQSAFTLIELMITMAIIAILATAGIQAYTGYLKKSRDTARAQIAQNLNTAVMSYAASNGGNPPASNEAFTQFLASSGEAFGGGSVSGSGSLSIEDPVGGKKVCLDAEGHADQPCSFNYTAYTDGTYAISYGVEDKSSAEGNFYKTTASVVAPGLKDQTQVTPSTLSIPKYGVYIGSAPYIGQEPTTSNGIPNDGVDEQYIPPDGDGVTVQPLIPAFRSIRVDTAVGVSEIVSGSTCTLLDICEGELSCISGQCLATNVGSDDPCTVSEQCASPLGCIINQCRTTNVAVNGTCTVPEQCASNLTCTGGVCTTPDPCAGTPAVGTVCADGTVYVTSTMRTTPSDLGSFYWQVCPTLGGFYGGCYNVSWDWIGPAAAGATNRIDGRVNIATLKVLDADLSDYPAAKACEDLLAHGYPDWYLPATDELFNLNRNSNCWISGNCYSTGAGVKGFTPFSQYWSSTEFMTPHAWYQNFSNGVRNNDWGGRKGYNHQVRCIRRP